MDMCRLAMATYVDHVHVHAPDQAPRPVSYSYTIEIYILSPLTCMHAGAREPENQLHACMHLHACVQAASGDHVHRIKPRGR
jgi:hypothetical protein